MYLAVDSVYVSFCLFENHVMFRTLCAHILGLTPHITLLEGLGRLLFKNMICIRERVVKQAKPLLANLRFVSILSCPVSYSLIWLLIAQACLWVNSAWRQRNDSLRASSRRKHSQWQGVFCKKFHWLIQLWNSQSILKLEKLWGNRVLHLLWIFKLSVQDYTWDLMKKHLEFWIFEDTGKRR